MRKSLLKHPTLIKYVISFSINCCRIYLYNILQLDKGPVESFSGCRIDSFFVRVIMPCPQFSLQPDNRSDSIAYLTFSLITFNLALQTMISPDGEYILSGSSDGNAYIYMAGQ